MAAVWAALIAKKKPRVWVEPGLSTGAARGVNKRGTEILHGGTRLSYMSSDVFPQIGRAVIKSPGQTGTGAKLAIAGGPVQPKGSAGVNH
jgi:hypothetical protein